MVLLQHRCLSPRPRAQQGALGTNSTSGALGPKKSHPNKRVIPGQDQHIQHEVLRFSDVLEFPGAASWGTEIPTLLVGSRWLPSKHKSCVKARHFRQAMHQKGFEARNKGPPPTNQWVLGRPSPTYFSWLHTAWQEKQRLGRLWQLRLGEHRGGSMERSTETSTKPGGTGGLTQKTWHLSSFQSCQHTKSACSTGRRTWCLKRPKTSAQQGSFTQSLEWSNTCYFV